MPHDCKGQLLKEGDAVVIRGKVKWVGTVDGDKFCNVTVKLDLPMPAYPDQESTISSINAAQVEKV
jgi:hypothetical protein